MIRFILNLYLLPGVCFVLFACADVKSTSPDLAPTSDCSGLRPEDSCQVQNPHMKRLWDNLQSGQYNNIAQAIEEIKPALALEPGELQANKAVGFLRTWQLGELYRLDTPDLGQLILGLDEASAHFARALEHENDPRLTIFKSTNEYMAAKQLGNTALEMETKAQFIEAVETWPELNYFVGGTMLSIFSQPGDPEFSQALEYMWQSVDLCAGEVVNRADPLPQMRARIRDERREGLARACSNSWLAPHSFEGFWLFFGDLLTKNGDLDLARAMYEFTQTAQNYERWPFKHVLEDRLANLQHNAMNFRLPVAEQDPKYHPVAEWSCTVCHQR